MTVAACWKRAAWTRLHTSGMEFTAVTLREMMYHQIAAAVVAVGVAENGFPFDSFSIFSCYVYIFRIYESLKPSCVAAYFPKM